MSDHYTEPTTEVSFGDIFETGFLYDVFLRADAVQMGTRDIPQKSGGGLAYASVYDRNREYVLGHGAPHQSVLITDNCVIDTALGQGRGAGPPRGRLLFAPITPSAGQEHIASFGRFPLPPWEGRFHGGVAELRCCFMVAARDIADHARDRVARLSATHAEDLELRWNAYAARRGPLATARNAEKVAELLAQAAGHERGESETKVAVAIAEALSAAWRVEGGNLEAVADAHDQGRGGGGETRALEAGLRELADKAFTAADALNESHPGVPPEVAP